MRSDALARRAQELAAQGAAFVTATVVRAQRPTSARAGDVALVTSDGAIEGFVGGICAESSVRLLAATALRKGEPVLLRILPGENGEGGSDEEGVVTVQNTCLSGGAVEVFLEPSVPAPRVHLVGAAPIARALARLGPELELELVETADGPPAVADGDLGMVVAAHGRGELEALRAGLEARLPYVGLVASRRRGAAIVDELRAAGVADELLERLDCPAGLDIGARTPPEIALSILARVVAARRSGAWTPPLRAPADSAPARFAVDPICGMSVPAEPSSPQLEHDGETIYFCCEGCRERYREEHPDAVGAA